MKKVLLISNYVFHYRQKVYNYFAERFAEDGYEYHVLSDEYQDAHYDFKFKQHVLPFSIKGYCDKINEIKPDAVIVFLHLKDKVQLPVILYCRMKGIPVIYWNKPNSSDDPNNKVKNIMYHFIQDCCDAVITYTPEPVSGFTKKSQKHLFVAFNSVNNTDIDKQKYDKSAIKEKYGIKEKRVILYISRMRKSKRIGVLLDAMVNQNDIAVVAMGAGMTPELQAKFDAAPNLYYLGQKYGEEGNEVWAMGDIFSIPENCGLGINDAVFWNLPIVTIDGKQAPEIHYLRNGKNGYLCKDEAEYKQRLLDICHSDELLTQLKSGTQEIFDTEVDIKNMYKGFINAVKFVNK